MRYAVYYFYEEGGIDTVCQYIPIIRLFLRRPSECQMFIPGTYAEMHEDYD